MTWQPAPSVYVTYNKTYLYEVGSECEIISTKAGFVVSIQSMFVVIVSLLYFHSNAKGYILKLMNQYLPDNMSNRGMLDICIY